MAQASQKHNAPDKSHLKGGCGWVRFGFGLTKDRGRGRVAVEGVVTSTHCTRIWQSALAVDGVGNPCNP